LSPHLMRVRSGLFGFVCCAGYHPAFIVHYFSLFIRPASHAGLFGFVCCVGYNPAFIVHFALMVERAVLSFLSSVE